MKKLSEREIQKELAAMRERQRRNGATGPLCQVALDVLEQVLREGHRPEEPRA